MNKTLLKEHHNNICEYCSQDNRIGDFFCHFCGSSLIRKAKTKPTRPPSFNNILMSVDRSESTLPENKPLILEIVDNDTTLIIQSKPQVVLGRSTLLGVNSTTIDIDLVPFDGFDKGVSNRHAIIRRDGDAVYLVDLGSKNGTILNGIQMNPIKSYQIHDGDVAYIGTLPIRFCFQ